VQEHTSFEQDLGDVPSSPPTTLWVVAQAPASGSAGVCRYCSAEHVLSAGTVVFAPVYQPERQNLYFRTVSVRYGSLNSLNGDFKLYFKLFYMQYVYCQVV